MFKVKLSLIISFFIFSCPIIQQASEKNSILERQKYSSFSLYKKKPTRLHQAALNNDLNAVTEILQQGDIDINICDQHGNTPLHYLVGRLLKNEKVSPHLLEIMIDAEADITIASKSPQFSDAKTPWEIVLKSNNFVAAKIILGKVNQENISLKNEEELTPEQVALKFGSNLLAECFKRF